MHSLIPFIKTSWFSLWCQREGEGSAVHGPLGGPVVPLRKLVGTRCPRTRAQECLIRALELMPQMGRIKFSIHKLVM